MKERNTNLDGALKWMEDAHDQIVIQFLADYKDVPSFNDPQLDAEVAIYVEGLADWVRANAQWSFEVSAPSFRSIHSYIDMFFNTQSQRYFGLKGLEMKAIRTVALLPKRLVMETGNLAERGHFVDSERGDMSSCRRDLDAVCFVEDAPQIPTAEPMESA
jgi:hypothetical protein